MAKTFLKSAMLIMIITLVGRVIGLVRGIFVGAEFGTTLEASAYRLAFTIPSTIFVFVPGALNAIFIPSLKGMITRGQELEAKQLFQKIFTLSILITFILSVILWIWAEPIISFISPGSSAELLTLSADLLRWMLPSLFFIILIGLFSSTLNVHFSFVLPNVGTIINSVIVILVLIVLAPTYSIYALALGTTLGFAGAALLMLPNIYKEKYTLTPNWQWRDPELRKIGERFVPIMLGSFITSVNEFIEKYLISGLGDDKIAALGYAKEVYQVPMAIFLAAFAMPLFPLLVEYVTKKEDTATKRTLEKGLNYLLLLMIPTTVGMVFLSKEMISVIYERGIFNVHSTEVTAFALIFFAIGLYPLVVRDMLTRAFYAMENTKIPVMAAIMQMIAYVISSLLFIPWLGFAGVAMGWTVGALVNALILWVILHNKIGSFVRLTFIWSIGRVLVSSSGMALFLYLFNQLSEAWNRYVQLGSAILLGALIYGVLLFLLREPLIADLLSKVLRRLKRNRA